jgi:hypothetical protein
MYGNDELHHPQRFPTEQLARLFRGAGPARGGVAFQGDEPARARVRGAASGGWRGAGRAETGAP